MAERVEPQEDQPVALPRFSLHLQIQNREPVAAVAAVKAPQVTVERAEPVAHGAVVAAVEVEPRTEVPQALAALALADSFSSFAPKGLTNVKTHQRWRRCRWRSNGNISKPKNRRYHSRSNRTSWCNWCSRRRRSHRS